MSVNMLETTVHLKFSLCLEYGDNCSSEFELCLEYGDNCSSEFELMFRIWRQSVPPNSLYSIRLHGAITCKAILRNYFLFERHSQYRTLSNAHQIL